MKIRCALFLVVLLGVASTCWADGELIYPWDNSSPAPESVVPCVPCVFSVPGLSALFSRAAPRQVPEEADAMPTVAAADLSGETAPVFPDPRSPIPDH